MQSGATRTVALDTWNAVSRKEGSCHMEAAEDDDGLDGTVGRALIFDGRRCLQRLMFNSMHEAAILHLWMEDAREGSNQG